MIKANSLFPLCMETVQTALIGTDLGEVARVGMGRGTDLGGAWGEDIGDEVGRHHPGVTT